MGASTRPERFDRAGARAAGYSDQEIDAYLASPEATQDASNGAQPPPFTDMRSGATSPQSAPMAPQREPHPLAYQEWKKRYPTATMTPDRREHDAAAAQQRAAIAAPLPPQMSRPLATPDGQPLPYDEWRRQTGRGVTPSATGGTFNPADRWEELVASGVDKAEATRRVRAQMQGGGQTGADGDTHPRAGWLKGLVQPLAQGVSFGMATPIISGAGTIVRKLQGDDRPLSEIYGQLKDYADTSERQYTQDYPKTSLAANVVGGLVSPASRAVSALAPANAMTWGGRAVNASAQGAAIGGVAGAVNEDGGFMDRATSGVKGAALGGALRGVFSVGADAIGQGARAAGFGPRAANAPGTASGIIRRGRQLVGAETAEDAGARRTLDIIRREGRTVDDVAARSTTADAPDVLGEVIGNRGVRGLRTARMIGDQSPTQIDDALADRAMNEAADLRAAFARLSGTNRSDAPDIAAEALARVKPLTDELYASASSAPLGADASRVADVITELDADGFGVWKLARKLGGMPESLGTPAARTPALDVAEDAAAQARQAWQSTTEAAAELEAYGALWEEVSANNQRTRSPNLTPAMRRKNTIQRRRPTDEILSRGEKRELGMDLTEDARARIEDAGFTPETFRELVQRGTDARRRLPGLEQRMQQADAALQQATTASGGTPVPDLTVGQALKVRQALDAMIDDSAERSADRIVQARLMEARDAVDQLVKRSGGNAAAAQAVQVADAVFTDAKRLGESFGIGVRAAQSGDKLAAARMLRSATHPEQARQGVGSEILRRLGGVVDEGRIQNAGPRVTGGDERRAITRMAFPDDATFDQFREQTNNATRRLATRNTVSGGSQTADKMADALDFAADPGLYTDAITGNAPGLLMKLGQTGIVRRLAGANAAEADQLTQYLLAGAPGQMSRDEAIRRLRAIQPQIQRRVNRTTTNRAVAGATVGNLVRRQ